MSTRRLWVAAMSVLVAACAIPQPPPGGPQDTRPPEVLATHPAADSVGIPVDSEIRISFDENMRKSRLERLVSFHPPAIIKKARWKGNELTIVLEEPLHPDTTYVVQLGAGFSDAHGVRSQKGFRFAFATSAAIDSGVIAGRVLFRREPSDKGVVRLFVLPRDTAFSVEAARPDRETTCGGDGRFRLEYLATTGNSFVIWAFQDKNGDANYNREKEAAAMGDTMILTGSLPRVEEVDIYITDPTEPASITGTVDNQTGVDSVPVVVTMHELLDSLPPTYYGRCAPDGSFTFKVLQGSYVLSSFLDLRNDSLCGTYPCPGDSASACPEPCTVYADTIHAVPGGKMRVGELILEKSTGD